MAPVASQGILRFPGLISVRSFTFTWGIGVAPSVAIVEVVPQDDFPTSPDVMTIEDDFNGIVLEFPFSIVDSATVQRNLNGMVTSVAIKDRRWCWKFLEPISGRYNLRNQDGSVWSPSEQSPQDLIALLAEAMGEEIDSSVVPNLARPMVQWDYANAAQELDRLVTSLGCRVTINNDSEIVICQGGVGADLPTALARSVSVGVDPPDKPDFIIVVATPTRYESAFQMVPVGEEMDGTIVPINQLSYTPASGWGSEGILVGYFGNVKAASQWIGSGPNQFPTQAAADDYAKSLAAKCVYRWFRIDQSLVAFEKASGTFTIQGCPLEVSNLWQILPIEDGRVTNFTDVDDIERPMEARVFGQWYESSTDEKPKSNFQDWKWGLSLDRQRGIVKLAKPCVAYTVGASPPYADPKLAILVAHGVKDPDTLIEDKFTFEAGVPGEITGAGGMVLQRHDIVRNVVGQYDSNWNPTGAEDNNDDISLEAFYYYQAALQGLVSFPTTNIEYAGIIPLGLDGAIQQITWRGGPSGAVTVASRNTEHAPEVMPYAEMQKLSMQQWLERHIGKQAFNKQGVPPLRGPLT